MKAKIVNQIKEYTDDIEVLKSIIKSDNTPALIDKVISVYKTLRKPQYKIRQEYADAIALSYIETMEHGNVRIEKLLCPEFLRNVRFVKKSDLKKVLDYAANYENAIIFEKNQTLANYSIKDLIELTKIYNRLPNDKYRGTTILMLELALRKGISPTIISKIIEEYQICAEDRKYRIHNYLSNNSTYNADEKDILTITHLLRTAKDENQAAIITDVALEQYWLGVVPFIDVYLELIAYAFENNINPVLIHAPSCKNIFRKRKIQEIKEMLIMCITYPSLEIFLTSEKYIEKLTWIQERNLCIDYNLHEEKMLMKFYDIISSLTESEIEEKGLYKALTDKLDKAVYEETVEEYLNRCSSIQEFTNAISRNYKGTDDIQGYSMLTLDKKVFE